jgi:ATP-dependent DNA helicase RecG
MPSKNLQPSELPGALENVEDNHLDYKSLRKATGPTADLHELAKDCVCFANDSGGRIVIGVEDTENTPPPEQRIDAKLPESLRKRIHELTVNVQLLPEVRTAANGGQYIVLTIPRSMSVASTSDGRYFMRVADTCLPIVGDDVMRLASERPSLPWETMTSLGIQAKDIDKTRYSSWLNKIRESDRVKESVKEKSDLELLEHYSLTRDGTLTNLGILMLGSPHDRARLGTAPAVQAIKYDEQGSKIAKYVWDDFTCSPIELLDEVWETIPDFRESYELPDGLFRTHVAAYEEAVVRELLVNALVHRPYTQRGDIFLNLRPDALEIVNPGRLPLGVTPQNILHQSRRRNDGLARIFHDLKLMEKEGTGFDLMYDRLLASGRPAPTVTEGADSVHVVIQRRILHPGVIRLIEIADQRYQLNQRERITLGLLGQADGLTSRELMAALELTELAALRPWLHRLMDRGLIGQAGRGTGTRYFVTPELLQESGLDKQTTLKRIQPHRLRALVAEDVMRFPGSAVSDIRRRIGLEVPARTLRRALTELTDRGQVFTEGERRWRRYYPSEPNR